MSTTDGDLNDSLTESKMQFRNSESSTNQSNGEESKKLVERDGDIGYLKNSISQPMTNFSVRHVGQVVDDSLTSSADGFS